MHRDLVFVNLPKDRCLMLDCFVAPAIKLVGKHERLVLLYDIGGRESYLLVAGLTARMGRPSWHLITIPWVVCARRLTFYWELQAAFHNIGRLDSRMSVPRNRHSRIHFCINDYRHITRNWTVRL